MKKLLLLLVLAFVTTFAFSQAKDSVSVTFRVSLKGSGRKLSTDGLRATGALGASVQADWSPTTALKMTATTPASDSIYAVTFKIPRPTNDTTQFKFINGGNWGDGTVAADNYTEDERGLKGSTCTYTGNGDGNRALITKGIAANGSLILPAFVFNSCKTVAATGTNDLKSASSLSIFPNPVFNNAVLSFSNIETVKHTLTLYSVTGQVVRTYAPSTSEQFIIETSNLSKGLYFARLSNDQGEASTLKFVAE